MLLDVGITLGRAMLSTVASLCASGRGLLDLRFMLGQEPSLAFPGGRGGMVSFREEIPEGKGVR